MRVHGLDLGEERGVKLRRRRSFARQPHEDVAIRLFHQDLKLIKLAVRQTRDFSVGELAEDQVHLAHAAMPGAEMDAAAAGVEACGGNLRAGQGGLPKDNAPDAHTRPAAPGL